MSRHFLIKTSRKLCRSPSSRENLALEKPGTRGEEGGGDFFKENHVDRAEVSSFTHLLETFLSSMEQRRLLEIGNCAIIGTILERSRPGVDEFSYGSLPPRCFAPRIIIPRLNLGTASLPCPTFEYLQIMGPARARNSPSFHRNLDRLYFQSRYKCS